MKLSRIALVLFTLVSMQVSLSASLYSIEALNTALGLKKKFVTGVAESKAPESYWKAFSENWEIAKKDRPEAIKRFREMAEFAARNNHPLLAGKAWDALRVQYNIMDADDALVNEATEQALLWISNYSITMYANLYFGYRDVGEKAKSNQIAERATEQMIEKYGKDASGHPKLPNYIALDHFLGIYINHLIEQGRPKEALDYFQSWLGEIHFKEDEAFKEASWWLKGTYVAVQSQWVKLFEYLDYPEEAQRVRLYVWEHLPLLEGYYSPTFWSLRSEYLLEQMRIEGVSDALIADFKETLEHENNIRLPEARLLYLQGQFAEALALTDQAIAKQRERYGADQKMGDLAKMLEYRVKFAIQAKQLEGVLEMIEEALGLRRKMGDKAAEPYIFKLYGQYHQAAFNFEEALNAYRQSVHLYEIMGRPMRVLDVQLDLFRLYLELGMKDEAAALWATILPKLEQAPLELQIKAWQLQAQYVKAFEGEASFEKARTRVDSLREQRRNAEALSGADAWDYTPEQSVAGKTVHMLKLSPYKTQTQVNLGEQARARFILSNYGSTAAQGFFTLHGARGEVQWAEDTGVLTYRIIESGDAHSISSERVEIPKNTECLVFLDKTEVLENARFGLEWVGEAASYTAHWDLNVLKEAAPLIQVVGRSEAREDRFYGVSFYHELYARQGHRQGIQDMRVKADAPARIEIWDADTGMLLAVDAQGNGSFLDSGDIIHADANLNLYPDVDLSGEASIVGLELVVFNLSEASTQETVTLDIQLQAGEQWVTHAQSQLVATP